MCACLKYFIWQNQCKIVEAHEVLFLNVRLSLIFLIVKYVKQEFGLMVAIAFLNASLGKNIPPSVKVRIHHPTNNVPMQPFLNAKIFQTAQVDVPFWRFTNLSANPHTSAKTSRSLEL